jgi:hypothetical protein
MESVKVRLRRKRGRRWDYQEIEIPTDAEMERFAAELHQKHVATLVTVLGWKVLYVPARVLNYSTTEVNPFTGEQGEKVEYETRTVSYCIFGHGAEWRVCYSWNQGDDHPPVRVQESGDIIPGTSDSQGTLFEYSGTNRSAELWRL